MRSAPNASRHQAFHFIGSVVLVSICCLWMFQAQAVFAQPIRIVAAENFYGDIAQQIGGASVLVTSILVNPEQDPHLFEASVSTAKALAGAKIVVYNGLGYDAWMKTLLSTSKGKQRTEITVGHLMQHADGDNPHIWYEIPTISKFAQTLATELESIDSANHDAYEIRLKAFQRSLQPLTDKIAALKKLHPGLVVTATEPVFGYMADALGMEMRNGAYQLAIMNDTEPSASDVIKMEQDIKSHQAKVLFYNSQASNLSAQKMKKLAIARKVPVVGVTETLPTGKHYQNWMLDQLLKLESSLSNAPQ